MARRSAEDVGADAEEALIRGLREALENSIKVNHGHPEGPDLVVSMPGSDTFAVEVKGVAKRAEPGQIANALPGWDAELESMRRTTGEHVLGVVVAGAVPEATKAILRDHGWGWLDRRGEIDILVGLSAMYTRSHREAPAIVTMEQALAMARELGDRAREALCLANRSRIRSNGYGQLVETTSDAEEALCLAREIGDPNLLAEALISLGRLLQWRAVFEGFDELQRRLLALADAWKPDRHAFAETPSPATGTRLELCLDSLDEPGWGVGSTVAAAAWQAPVVVASGAPPDFYVPSEHDLRAAQRELRAAHTVDERACTIAVAPTVLVVRPRYDAPSPATPWLHWPVVHPLFVALDLALDRARGVEILGDWNPPAPFRRVW